MTTEANGVILGFSEGELPSIFLFAVISRQREVICACFSLCPGNAKPEGSPILPHEPAKIKQEDNKDMTRPSRPAVSFKNVFCYAMMLTEANWILFGKQIKNIRWWSFPLCLQTPVQTRL